MLRTMKVMIFLQTTFEYFNTLTHWGAMVAVLFLGGSS